MRRKTLIRVTSLSILGIYFLAYFFKLVSLPHFSVFAIADLTEASVRLSRMDVNAAASGTDPILIVAKPASTATEASLQVTFSTGGTFTVDGTPANVTISTSSLPSTYQGETLYSWPGVGSAATGVAGQVVTIASDDLTVGQLYGFYITGGVTNPGSAGEREVTITTRASGPTNVDTKTTAVDIVANDTDLVSVTASVVPTFNFALLANSITLGDLSTSATVNGNVTIDVDTNAGNGWVAWTKSANAGLTSTSTSDTVNTQGTVDNACSSYSTGNEYYQLDVLITNGTGGASRTEDLEYDCTGTDGGTFATTYEEIGISNGPVSNDTITLTVYAAASSLNEAADDYGDTLTVIGAGNF